jgi:hypothetical protein
MALSHLPRPAGKRGNGNPVKRKCRLTVTGLMHRRRPRAARSIEVLVAPELLPVLH